MKGKVMILTPNARIAEWTRRPYIYVVWSIPFMLALFLSLTRGMPTRSFSQDVAGGEALLKQLETIDGVYQAGFTASGTYTIVQLSPRHAGRSPARRKWQITRLGERLAHEEELIEVLAWDDVRLEPGEKPVVGEERESLLSWICRFE